MPSSYRLANNRGVFALIGRVEAENAKELSELLALEKQQLVLDFGEVTLVNQDAVEFLAGCEADSIHDERICSARLETCRPK